MAEREQSNILQAIRDLKSHEPFSPFRIVMASGDKYLIETAENLVEMKTELFYASPGSDRFVLMRINQIVAIEREEKRSARRKAS